MNRRMERALAGLTAVSMRSRSGHGIFDSSGGRAFNLARYSSAPVSPAISIDRPQEPHMLGGCLAASAIGESWSIRLKFCCGAKHHNKSRDNKLVILTPEIRLSLH